MFSINGTKPTSDNTIQLDYQIFSYSDRSELVSKLGINPGLADQLKSIHPIKEDSPVKTQEAKSVDEIIVTTLGTGSAAPSKYRNVSSTLLHIPNRQGSGLDFVLLDAGEGTLGQIKRKFGLEWQETLRRLKIIFISHLHADHHCGLASILQERSELDNCAPLALVCQYGIYLHLSEKSVIESLGLTGGGIQWFNSEHLLKSSDKRIPTQQNIEALISCDLKIETIPVKHWGKCFGVCIEDKTENWKIVFSGDTKPCQALIDAGQDADLLIHEASLGPEETELAETKGHSTIDQAIQVALKMKAKNCVLNHFSGRYPKIPPSINTTPEHEMKMAIAFDFMTCKIGEIGALQKCIPALEQMVEGLELDESTVDPQPPPTDPSPSSSSPSSTKNKSTQGKKSGPGSSPVKRAQEPQALKEEVDNLSNQVVPEPPNIDRSNQVVSEPPNVDRSNQVVPEPPSVDKVVPEPQTLTKSSLNLQTLTGPTKSSLNLQTLTASLR